MVDGFKTGGFWAGEESPREHCYKIANLEREDVVTNKTWEIIYNTLGGLGYLFRDAGHCINYALVSLDKSITKKDLKQLENLFLITKDGGDELGFC